MKVAFTHNSELYDNVYYFDDQVDSSSILGKEYLVKLFSRWKRQFLERHEKKDPISLTARSYTVRHYLRQIWKYKEISVSPHAVFQWRFLTTDFPCHRLSPNQNEYSSWHSVDTSRVLEHGTKNIGPYRVISAPRYALFHTVHV